MEAGHPSWDGATITCPATTRDMLDWKTLTWISQVIGSGKSAPLFIVSMNTPFAFSLVQDHASLEITDRIPPLRSRGISTRNTGKTGISAMITSRTFSCVTARKTTAEKSPSSKGLETFAQVLGFRSGFRNAN